MPRCDESFFQNKKPQPEGEAIGADRESASMAILVRFDRLDHDVLAHGAFVEEFDAAGDLSKERVVFAAADIEPGLYAGAALADDDGAAGDDLSAECLEA